jgi:hypothetical protein
MEIEEAVSTLQSGGKLLLSIGDRAEPFERDGVPWVKVTSLFEGRPPTYTLMRLGTFAGLYSKHRFALDYSTDATDLSKEEEQGEEQDES